MRGMGHDRRFVALVVIAAGVSVQWGIGFGLIVGGVLFGLSDLEPRPWLTGVRARWRRGWGSLRLAARGMPRRTTAAVLVSAAAVLLPVGALLAAGVWAALVAAGGLALTAGVALGWE